MNYNNSAISYTLLSSMLSSLSSLRPLAYTKLMEFNYKMLQLASCSTSLRRMNPTCVPNCAPSRLYEKNLCSGSHLVHCVGCCDFAFSSVTLQGINILFGKTLTTLRINLTINLMLKGHNIEKGAG